MLYTAEIMKDVSFKEERNAHEIGTCVFRFGFPDAARCLLVKMNMRVVSYSFVPGS